MIDPVKKFGRARLTTSFRGNETWRTFFFFFLADFRGRKAFVKICEHVAYFTFKRLK